MEILTEGEITGTLRSIPTFGKKKKEEKLEITKTLRENEIGNLGQKILR